MLFHNHINDDGLDTLNYKYPLIQYKRIGGQAAIVCIGEGAEAIGEFFAGNNAHINIGSRDVVLNVSKVKAEKTLLQLWNSQFTYNIRKYLPLNQANYNQFCKTDSLVEKYTIIEKCLVGNILSFAKNMDVFFEEQIYAKITSLDNARLYVHKGVKMMGFDLMFTSNVSLPDFIGLGRGVSVGFGMITRNKTKEE